VLRVSHPLQVTGVAVWFVPKPEGLSSPKKKAAEAAFDEHHRLL
jgi:hypothetical protein